MYEFTKFARYKVNIQKSVGFLYANNKLSERETEGKNHLQPQQRIKYLGISLIKGVRNLNFENIYERN